MVRTTSIAATVWLVAAPVSARPAAAETESAAETPEASNNAEATPAESGPAEEVTPPELVHFVEADYPAGALADGVEASVLLEIDIDEEGQVEGVAVVRPAAAAGYGFDETAARAANLFEFEPARVGETAVPVRITYEYNFVLPERPEPAPSVEEEQPETTGVVTFSGVLLQRGTRTPLAGVVVTVFRGDGEAAEGFEAITDANGSFALFDLPAGAWKVLAEPDGYYPLRTVEDVVAGERTDATYYVEQRSFNPYDVLVAAPLPRKEVNRTSIDAVQADKVPGTFGDVLAVVQNLPGVARTQPGFGLLVVRGSAPEDTQIFVDGVSVPLLYHFGGLRSVIPVGMLERLDFYPGNFSVQYGRATGGVLDIGVKKLQPDALHGYVDVNLFDAGLFLEVPITETFAVALAGRRSYVDFILDAAVPDDASVALVTAPRYYDYQLLASWRPAPAHDVRAFLLGSDDELALLFANPGDADTRLGSASVGAETRFYRALLEYRYVPSETFQNTFKTSAGRNWLDFGAGDRFVFDLDFYVAQIRDTARWRPLEWLTLTGGVDYLLGRASGRFKLPFVAKEGERQGQPDLSDILTSKTEDDTFHSLGLFAEAELRPIENLLLVPGVRFDHFTRAGKWSFDPRLSARYRLSDAWTAKAGVGLFHQEPAFDETDTVFGNPDLGLESAIHYSAGLELEPFRSLTVDGTLFYKDLRGLVSRTDAVAEQNGEIVPQRYDNNGTGRVYGFELLARRELADNFFGWLSYTLSRAERRDSGSGAHRLFDYDQTHVLALLGSYRLPRNWEVGLRWRYVTGALDTPVIGGTFDADADQYEPITGAPNSVRVGAFHQLDLRVEKRWVYDTWSLSAYVDIQNVYNRGNQEDLEYNYDFSQQATEAGLPILTVLGVRAEI